MPGSFNLGADVPSRGNVAPGERTLHPQMVPKTWAVFGERKVEASR